MTFNLLQPKSEKFAGIETFPAPPDLIAVTLLADEVTAICPITGQPDQYTVELEYHPFQWCIESKSMKFYFQQFRNEGIFCEAFSAKIASDIAAAIQPKFCRVKITQKSRGGISIVAESLSDHATG